MMIKIQKAGTSLNALIIFYMFIGAALLLAGCGGSENIPPASVLSSGRVTLSWNQVPGAASYNVYFATSPGVTALNSFKISDVSNPITITDLEPGTTYYFVVTVEDDSGASRKSKEVAYTVADTNGSIQFGDILSQSKSEGKSIASEAAPASNAQVTRPEKKAATPEEVPAAATPVVKSAEKPDSGHQPMESAKPTAETIICFGDSLTFGTGAGKGMDYPSQLAKMLRKPVINQGIPGDTTASALGRLYRDVLSKNPAVVLITLGGNDLKNGVSRDFAFDNLKMIVESIQERGAKVIIGGLKIPDVDRGFGKAYEELAKQTGATLIPNIYEGIMGNRQLMSDPIHPNDAGYRIIAERFYSALAPSEKSRTAEAGNSETRDVTLAWDSVPNAASYNIYWSDKPGVTRQNGTKISDVKNPYKMKGLIKGKKYYFVVTAVNASGESRESEEFSFTVGQ
jgi:acyl-CoA thioesterase I